MSVKSRNRIFAELLSSGLSGKGTDHPEATIDRFEAVVAGDGNTAIDTISANSVSAVTYHVNASKGNDNHFTILSAVKNSSGSIDYTEYGTLITSNALAEFSVELNNSNIELYADPTTTSVTFNSTRIVVEI